MLRLGLWVCVLLTLVACEGEERIAPHEGIETNIHYGTINTMSHLLQGIRSAIEFEFTRAGTSNFDCRTNDNDPHGAVPEEEKDEYLDEKAYIAQYAFTAPLPIPAVMQTQTPPDHPSFDGVHYYEIGARKVEVTGVLQGTYTDSNGVERPRATQLFAYGETNNPDSFSFPARSIEAHVGQKVVVRWVNELSENGGNPANAGNFLSHMFPVDPTLHWADPECQGHTIHDRYEGPVPLVTHFHGGHTNEESDGFPESWVLPNADNLPEGIRKVGPAWELFRNQSEYGQWWTSNSVVSDYVEERAAHFWYHDHAIGITRLNVHAGLAGNLFIRDDYEDQLPSGELEIPLMLTERTFYNNGSMWFPDSPFSDFPRDQQRNQPFMGEPTCNGYGPSDVPPIWASGVLGAIYLVNGVAFPYHNVYPTCYRLRFLSASNGKEWFLAFQVYDQSGDPVDMDFEFRLIGSDHGQLNKAHDVRQVVMTPAERIDALVDFSVLPPGYSVEMFQDIPCAPDQKTRQVMSFNVTAIPGGSPVSTRTCSSYINVGAVTMDPPPPPDLDNVHRVRQLYSHAWSSESVIADSIITGSSTEYCAQPDHAPVNIDWMPNKLGLLGQHEVFFRNGTSTGRLIAPKLHNLLTMSNTPFVAAGFADPITEYPVEGETEIIELFNLTPQKHPIHIHVGFFTVLGSASLVDYVDHPEDPGWFREPWEDGAKDVVANPAYSVTRIAIKFSRTGLYVFHCHILTHEDRDMMRPMCLTHESGELPKSCEMQNHGWGHPCTNHDANQQPQCPVKRGPVLNIHFNNYVNTNPLD